MQFLKILFFTASIDFLLNNYTVVCNLKILGWAWGANKSIKMTY